MPAYLPFVLIGIVALSLVAWSVAAQSGRRRAARAAVERLGLQPCPDKKTWLEQTVAVIENNSGYRHEVRDPKCLPGEPAVYFYTKARYGDPDRPPVVQDEILFPLKRPSPSGLVLAVKQSALAPGLATRLIGAVATGPWDAQPDDLQKLELPPELKETNLIGALGPPGATLYQLIDTRALGVVQGFGDAGAQMALFRDGWCAASGASAQIPFRVEDLVALIRPLL